jgi:hypothetical protein
VNVSNSGTHGTGTRSYARDPGSLLITPADLPSGFFFSDEGARIARVNDRLFLGAAAYHDGATLGGGSGADWFSAGTGSSAGLAWVNYLATVALVTTRGTVGYAAASRASDVPADLGTSQISIPFVGIGIMDRAGSGPPYWTSYGAYLEARIEPESAAIGTVIGAEIDAINFGSAAGESTPWRLQTLGGATALWLASGGDPANHGRAIAPAQLALGIVNNGQTFESGIVFAAEAIEGTDGLTGFGNAINLATRHIVGWWADDGGIGERVNYITSTSSAPGHSLQFQTGGSLFVGAGGAIDFAVANVASAVNGGGVVPAATGNPVIFEAFGDDTNVDLALRPKAAGNVRMYADALLFYSDAGNQLAYVQQTIGTPANVNGLIFADGGPFFYGLGGVIASFGQVASPVSHLSFTNAATGNPVGIAAQGSGDIDILLDPAGSNGTLRLALPSTTSATAGGASALPGVPAGYFTVKDAGGTSRKLPYWNA